MILIYSLICIPRLLCLCRVETLESLPVHSFNGVIISKCQSLHFTITFRIPLPHDSNLKSPRSFICIPHLLCLCRVETLESLPVHSFNSVLLSLSARVCTLQSPFVFLFLMILIYTFFCMPRMLCLCRVETIESLPVHSFNGVIISKCQSLHFTITFRIPLPHDSNLYLYLHTTPVVFVPCGDPRKFPHTFI